MLIKIFNPKGDDIGDRPIWYGDTTNIIQLNNVKHTWASGLYKQMREKFWIPQKIDLSTDVNDYKNLTDSERRAFNGILSYLTFLDSIQVSNLPNIELPVTAPEVKICLSEQKFFETIHAESYQYIIESIIPTEERAGIYDLWRTDPVLLDRCEFVAKFYQNYIDESSPESYFISLIANYILEGIYFYNGFTFFYTLASRHLMGGTADIIKLIQRDELDHVRLFQKLIPEAIKVFPHSVDQILEMVYDAVYHEVKWSTHILDSGVLGITDSSINQYTKYLANLRLGALGLPEIYEKDEASNPYKHLEKIADTENHATAKVNFFESSVTSYVMSSALNDWDSF